MPRPTLLAVSYGTSDADGARRERAAQRPAHAMAAGSAAQVHGGRLAGAFPPRRPGLGL